MRVSRKLAQEIAEATLNGPRALIDGGIALCKYVARQYSEELTIAQGAKLQVLVQQERQKFLDQPPTSLSQAISQILLENGESILDDHGVDAKVVARVAAEIVKVMGKFHALDQAKIEQLAEGCIADMGDIFFDPAAGESDPTRTAANALRDMLGKLLIPSPQPDKIVICVEGGVVQGVSSSSTLTKVELFDFDVFDGGAEHDDEGRTKEEAERACQEATATLHDVL